MSYRLPSAMAYSYDITTDIQHHQLYETQFHVERCFSAVTYLVEDLGEFIVSFPAPAPRPIVFGLFQSVVTLAALHPLDSLEVRRKLLLCCKWLAQLNTKWRFISQFAEEFRILITKLYGGDSKDSIDQFLEILGVSAEGKETEEISKY